MFKVFEFRDHAWNVYSKLQQTKLQTPNKTNYCEVMMLGCFDLATIRNFSKSTNDEKTNYNELHVN